MKTKLQEVDEKTYISKQEISKLTNVLAKKIKDSGKEYEYIVGIARGGLNISRPLAKKLKIKHTSIRISFYAKAQTLFPQFVDVTRLVSLPLAGKKILFVDDLIDAGHTFGWIRENLEDYYDYDTAVLYWNQHNRIGLYPTFYGAIKPESWIVFPWENKNT